MTSAPNVESERAATRLAKHARSVRLAIALGAFPLLGALAVRTHHLRTVHGSMRGPLDLGALSRSDELLPFAAAGEVLTSVAFAVACAYFIALAHRAATTAGAERLRIGARAAAWSALLPVVQLFVPFLVYRHLASRTDVAHLPPPTSRLRSEGHDGYRDHAGEPIPSPIAGPRPPIAFCCVAFVAAQGLARGADYIALRATDIHHVVRATQFDIAADVAFVVAIALALRVVRGVDARVREFERRRRFADS
jgi:hypothetical protein